MTRIAATTVTAPFGFLSAFEKSADGASPRRRHELIILKIFLGGDFNIVHQPIETGGERTDRMPVSVVAGDLELAADFDQPVRPTSRMNL